jgi:hypothetical protein
MAPGQEACNEPAAGRTSMPNRQNAACARFGNHNLAGSSFITSFMTIGDHWNALPSFRF